MKTVDQASNTIELGEIVEHFATYHNCELDASMTYREQAEFFQSEYDKGEVSLSPVIGMLILAEERWNQLENTHV